MDCEDTARQRGQAKGNSETAGWVVLSAEERESLKELKMKKQNARKSPGANKAIQLRGVTTMRIDVKDTLHNFHFFKMWPCDTATL
jgi:hypothetical protein